MKRFRIDLRGENFLFDLDGDHGKFGFLATRVIKANTREEAERIALIRIHQELNQDAPIVKNTPDAPRVLLDNVAELNFFQRPGKKRCRGFKFISEETIDC